MACSHCSDAQVGDWVEFKWPESAQYGECCSLPVGPAQCRLLTDLAMLPWGRWVVRDTFPASQPPAPFPGH